MSIDSARPPAGPAAVAEGGGRPPIKPVTPWARVASWPAARAFVAVAVLFAISPLIAPGSVSATAMSSMLPFAALTAVVAVGQTLVIMQGGLDLSVAGAITLGALIVAKFGGPDQLGLGLAIVVALVVPALFGLLSGLVIALFGLPPLVVTIASNALMVGTVQAVSGGYGGQVVDSLSQFSLSRWLGIPVLAIIATIVVLVVHVLLKAIRVGRRFELVGANPRAARTIGFSTNAYVVGAYTLSALLAAACGVLLAGLLRSPTLTAGDAYLLPSIAAVVLGGTALTGGKGSVVGTALGALFLGQLGQLVQTFTQTTAAQNIIQAVIIAVGIVVQIKLGGNTSRLRAMVTRSPSKKSTALNEESS
ncbi:ABC transporter permease [Herbiconiux moechotypicola]|uniref:ABC transporter permease n=1 Tax=Herbiconiux moechotypicola TaxID=637393 RepID=A0ABP5Q6L4_9MICO|nr:ABC transporter permease [Herbiconiux moechotypicola]MCS5728711.1 ABC transporter permease [Herbiconiux moechotypicola]